MTATARSIHEQFAFWRRLPALPKLPARALHVVTGCGTSFHLSQSIAASFNQQGHAAIAVPAGEWSRRPAAYVTEGSADVHLLALSRSGETTETLQAIAASRAAGHAVTALTCAADSSFGRLPGVVLPTHPEEGIVMTASASIMLLAALRMGGVALGEATVAAAQTLLGDVLPHLPALVQSRSHLVFLGGGALHGIAQEGAIKLQEMSLSFAQGYHPLEYRHGPISLVDGRTLAVAMFEPDARPEETRIVADIRDKGGRVLGLGGPGDVAFRPGGESGGTGLVCLPVLQALGEAVAAANGLDTAAPRHLNKVVILG